VSFHSLDNKTKKRLAQFDNERLLTAENDYAPGGFAAKVQPHHNITGDFKVRTVYLSMIFPNK
jgi:hypothetical protein